MLTHPTGLFSGDYISALRGCRPSNFYARYSPLKYISSRTRGTGRPHVGLCPIFLVYFLISQWISELRRPIATKLYHVITIYSDQIIHVQKFGGPPLKNFGAKNMHN